MTDDVHDEDDMKALLLAAWLLCAAPAAFGQLTNNQPWDGSILKEVAAAIDRHAAAMRDLKQITMAHQVQVSLDGNTLVVVVAGAAVIAVAFLFRRRQ